MRRKEHKGLEEILWPRGKRAQKEIFGPVVVLRKFIALFHPLGGILTHSGQLSNKAKENLRKALEEMHQGADNASRLMILEEGLKYEQITMPPKDAHVELENKGLTDETEGTGL